MTTKENGATNGASNGGALEKRPPSKMTTLKDAFDKSLPTLQRAATKALPADRVVGMVIAAASRNPQLLDCTMSSIIQCSMIATELGLQPSAQLGECYLIPRKNGKTGQLEANFQLGYRGMLTLSRRSGLIGSVQAQLVYRGEIFEVEFGLTPKLRHVPDFKSRPPIASPKEAAEHVEYVYAVAAFKDGSTQFEVMSLSQVEAIREKFSKVRFGPWFEHWGEMAKKTALRRLGKYLPMSAESAMAVVLDGKVEAGEMVDPGELGFQTTDDAIEADYEEVPPEHQTGTDKLKGAMA